MVNTKYNRNEVVLQFDTINNELTITGTKDSVFFTRGTYSYNIILNDTAYSFANPRDPSSTIYRVYDKLEIPSLTSDYIIIGDSSLVIDYSFLMADDERYFHFTK